MLKIFTFLFLALVCHVSYAQNVGINSTGEAPHESAGLDVNFTNKGFLMPRMTAAQKLAISNPGLGLMIYQTDDTPGIYFYSGSAWVYNGSGSKWASVDSNIVYTTTNSGNVGIGTTSFLTEDTEKLLVSVGTEGSINAISARGNNSSYVQINVKNYSNGENASSDIVATNDTGDEEQGYIDMGINSSGNSAEGTLGGPNKAYLFSTGDDFVIGNGTPGKNLTLYSTNALEETTEKLRLNSTGVTFSQSLKTLTSAANNNYTLGIDDYTIICNLTGSMSVYLPDVAAFAGRTFFIKKGTTSWTGYKIYVRPQSGQYIENSTLKEINRDLGSIMLQSDGETWYVIIESLN